MRPETEHRSGKPFGEPYFVECCPFTRQGDNDVAADTDAWPFPLAAEIVGEGVRVRAAGMGACGTICYACGGSVGMVTKAEENTLGAKVLIKV